LVMARNRDELSGLLSYPDREMRNAIFSSEIASPLNTIIGMAWMWIKFLEDESHERDHLSEDLALIKNRGEFLVEMCTVQLEVETLTPQSPEAQWLINLCSEAIVSLQSIISIAELAGKQLQSGCFDKQEMTQYLNRIEEGGMMIAEIKNSLQR
jgi:hypothetical protein